MTVGRAIAAQRHPAFLARPEMNPLRAGLHTLFTFPAFGMPEGLDGAQMSTGRVFHEHRWFSFH